LKRLLIGHATDVEMDGSGRILVAPPLREFAGLLKASVLIGQGNKFEVWAEDTWNTRRSEWLGSENTGQDDLPPELESLSL
jgi:MraZ protein